MKVKAYHAPAVGTIYIQFNSIWFPFRDDIEGESILDVAFKLAKCVYEDPESWANILEPRNNDKKLILSLNYPDSTQPPTT